MIMKLVHILDKQHQILRTNLFAYQKSEEKSLTSSGKSLTNLGYQQLKGKS